MGAHNIFHVSQLKRHIPGGLSTSLPEPIQVESEEHFNNVDTLLVFKRFFSALDIFVVVSAVVRAAPIVGAAV